MANHIAMSVNTNNTWSRAICRGVADYARRQGDWRLLLYHGPAERIEPRPDGLLGIFAAERAEVPATWRASGLPWINISNHDPPADAVSVYSDENAIGTLAADTLLDLGFEHFAFCGFASLAFSRGRYAGYRDRLAAAGAAAPVMIDSGHTAMRDQLGELAKPAALFAASDDVAQRVIQACEELRLEVPSQLAILGVDNDELTCEWSRVTISSIKPDFHRVGYEAAAVLHGMMLGKAPPRKTTLIPPLGVVARRSTDTLAVGDAVVRRALELIRAEACRGLSVEDLVDALPVSRRSLERRFAAALGRTPYDEVRRTRLKRGRELLGTTDMSVLSVTLACGLSDQRRFAAEFRREFGQTPSAYRRATQPGRSLGV